jgi:hypothetical protein
VPTRERRPPAGCAGRPARTPPAPTTPSETLALQRSAGNAATVRALARRPLRQTGPQLHLDDEFVQKLLEDHLPADDILAHLGDAEPPKDADKPPPDPAEPSGFEKRPREASVGMLAGALQLQPQIKRALDNLEWQTYGRLGPGDKTTLAVAGITFAAGTVGGLLATRQGRDLIGQLSGVQLPVPKAPGLSFEFSLKNDDLIGLGIHVDVGELLGGRWGFGTARPQDSAIPLYGGR